MPTILVDVYDGTGTRFYWDNNCVANIYRVNETIYISGNEPFFRSLAKQMVYLSSNDLSLPLGTHLHYDQSFEHNHTGLELVLELLPSTHQEIALDTKDLLAVCVNLPASIDQLHNFWHCSSKMIVSNADVIHILADYHGLMFMATVLLFLVENKLSERTYLCSQQRLQGWLGHDIIFELTD